MKPFPSPTCTAILRPRVILVLIEADNEMMTASSRSSSSPRADKHSQDPQLAVWVLQWCRTSYLTPFAEKPEVLVPVLPQQVHGALRRSQAAVGGRSVDALAVVLKLQVPGPLEAGLVLLDDHHGVLRLTPQESTAAGGGAT